jgi:hypothetical protein
MSRSNANCDMSPFQVRYALQSCLALCTFTRGGFRAGRIIDSPASAAF